MNDYASRLRAARQLRGWNQTELAREAGINSSEVSRFECGLSPTLGRRQKMAAALGYEPEELFPPRPTGPAQVTA